MKVLLIWVIKEFTFAAIILLIYCIILFLWKLDCSWNWAFFTLWSKTRSRLQWLEDSSSGSNHLEWLGFSFWLSKESPLNSVTIISRWLCPENRPVFYLGVLLMRAMWWWLRLFETFYFFQCSPCNWGETTAKLAKLGVEFFSWPIPGVWVQIPGV